MISEIMKSFFELPTGLQIGTCIFLICLIAGVIMYFNEMESAKTVLSLAFIVLFVSIMIQSYINVNENNIALSTAQKRIDEGAKVYIDGQLVDPDKIILEEYKITIRDGFIILH